MLLQRGEMMAIGGNTCSRYEGMAFDGCYYYLTLPNCCLIHQFNLCFQLVKEMGTCRGYTSITYDKKEQCFWAIGKQERNKLYRLDACMGEFDGITVDIAKMCSTRLTGVSCLCKKDDLLIAGDGGLFWIQKENNPTPICLKGAETGTCFTGAEELYGLVLGAWSRCQDVGISLFDKKGNTKMNCYLPMGYCVEDMTICCPLETCLEDRIHFYLLLTKCGNYSYVMKCSLIRSWTCLEPFGDCCFPICPPPCEKPLTCQDSCNGIIQSIALIETALSHILNAEGEKIQKVIETAEDTCDILKVNDAVNKTITNITHLEQVLFSKLQTAKEMYPDCCKENPHCKEKPHCDEEIGGMNCCSKGK